MFTVKGWTAIPFLLVFMGWLPPGVAETVNYEQIHFQVERSVQVNNDRMQARMAVQAEGEDPATLARRVNEAMKWALGEANAYSGVTAHSGSYQTYPMRVKDVVKSWVVSQELQLESGDIPALSELVGKLQTRMQVKNMTFSVSADSRRRAEDSLIEAALEAFRSRAGKIQKSMGARGYRLIAAHVQSNHHFPGPVPMMRSQMASIESSMPAVSSGETELQVTVSGSIELQLP